jgi:hypothetical protein
VLWSYPKQELLDAEHNDLVEILATANNLEELKLNFTVLGDHVRNWSRLNRILGTCTWPRLQSLYLSYHRVDGKELTDFIPPLQNAQVSTSLADMPPRWLLVDMGRECPTMDTIILP